MLIRSRLFDRDEADGAGDPKAAGTAGSAAADGNVAGEKGAGDPNKGKTLTPEDYQKSLTERESRIKDLESKLGKQGTELEMSRKLSQGFKENPKAMMEALSNKYGIPLAKEKPPENPFSEDDDPRIAQLFEKVSALETDNARLRQGVGSAAETFVEAEMARQHPDYDGLKEAVGVLKVSHQSGKIPDAVLYYHAARGYNLDQALADAGKQAVETYKADLAKKAAGQIEGGHPIEKDKGKPGDFASVVRFLP